MTYAVTYASAYKGAGRNGYTYTTSSVRTSAPSFGMAQAPVASIGSTRGSSSRGMGHAGGGASVSVPQIKCITTFASNVSGGTTSSETYEHIHSSGPHKAGSPDTPPTPDDDGYCEHCHYVWDQSLNNGRGGWVCSVCGSELKDGCIHMEEEGYCWCPIEDGWQVWLFVAALAAAYMVYKNARKENTTQAI